MGSCFKAYSLISRDVNGLNVPYGRIFYKPQTIVTAWWYSLSHTKQAHSCVAAAVQPPNNAKRLMGRERGSEKPEILSGTSFLLFFPSALPASRGICFDICNRALCVPVRACVRACTGVVSLRFIFVGFLKPRHPPPRLPRRFFDPSRLSVCLPAPVVWIGLALVVLWF